jgi:uncharacterized damage-inducible protein DinB
MKVILTICALLASSMLFAQQVQKETSGMITFAADRISQLAEAIPVDKYDWSPEEGVRSVSGIIAHVISVNYFFGSKMGAMIPEGVNPQTVEQDYTTKEELTAALKKSTDFVVNAVNGVSNDALADKVEFPFPGEYTTMTAILIAQGHCNEHLGQLIAYSRMNGITPPWSQATAEN